MGKRLIVLAALLLAALLLSACGRAAAPDSLRVTLLKVGKADAIVMECGGETLVLDAADRSEGRKLLRFLQDEGVETVDVLIISHYDRDHVGGAAELVRAYPPRRVLLPDYVGACAEYGELMAALEEQGIVPERLRESLELDLGSARVLVEPPENFVPRGGGEQDNNFSLITTVCHGEKRLVFAGDAEKRRIRQWLQGESAVPCDFLKVPHHGVYDPALEELFTRLSPAYAVICSSNKNPADSRVLDLLGRAGAQVYETRAGSVTVLSDGRSLTLTQSG